MEASFDSPTVGVALGWFVCNQIAIDAETPTTSNKMPDKISRILSNLAKCPNGTMSPYPTVAIVTTLKYSASPMPCIFKYSLGHMDQTAKCKIPNEAQQISAELKTTNGDA